MGYTYIVIMVTLIVPAIIPRNIGPSESMTLILLETLYSLLIAKATPFAMVISEQAHSFLSEFL